jgi:hypothetical protein
MDVTNRLRRTGRRALFERTSVVAAAFAVVALGARTASAESVSDPKAEPPKSAASVTSKKPAAEPMVGVADEALSRIIDRPHTVAEIEIGIVALPTAPISAGQSGGDTPFGTIGRGDATMQTGLHVLYRFHRNFALGAGALFSPFPTSDPEYGGLRQLPRTHSRGYFFFGGEGRWVPLHWKFFEGWVGVSIGGVVVADRFNTDSGDRVAPILGTKEVTIRTEGFAAGLQFGGTYYITENWIAGTMFRAYRWILPDTPRCSSIGDCGTLSGSITALEFGITIGYRLPL